MGTLTSQSPGPDLQALKTELTERANEVVGKAAEFARERPHVAVGVALGVGWVLGNGLPPRVIMAAARLGWKAAIGGMLAGGGLGSLLSREPSASGEGAASQSARGSRGTTNRATRDDGLRREGAPSAKE